MSIFANGDFKIINSWENRASSKGSRKSSRNSSRQKPKNSLINAGQKILQPTPDILDNRAMNQILRQFKAQIPPSPSVKSEKKISGKQSSQSNRKYPPRQKTKGNEDGDLLVSMASRLKDVECTCENQRKQIKEKNALIEKLKAQNTFMKGMRQNSDDACNKLHDLTNKNVELEKKVKEMEEYLKKYGIKWVGNKIQGSLQHQKMKKDIKNAKHDYRLPSEIDIGTIQRRVEELNGGLHSQGFGNQIHLQNGVHKFRKAEPLPIGFYGDGIAIKGYNFYPYKSKESLKILSDLVDGYFPYILKQKYPNGVFLKVVDNISQKYEEQQNKEEGRSIKSYNQIEKNQFKAPSKQQFLNKLPKNVIKNGKVIPIRGQIQKKLNGMEQIVQQNTQFWEEVDGCYRFKSECCKKIEKGEVESEEVCTLKIRTETGKICILQIEKEKKTKQIYKWMKKIVTKKFKLRGNFPSRTYQQNQAEDLEELGFYPNAILHVQLQN